MHRLWKSVRSKGRTTGYKKGYDDSFYNRNEEFDEEGDEVDVDNMTLEEYERYELAMSKRKSEVDIDNMTIEEYELYIPLMVLHPSFFNQSPHTPNPPLDEKDLSLEEIFSDLFGKGAKNLKRKEQKEVQNVCADKKS
nr:hypothetical protein [Tanacetum cinerariifolium]